jgi:hypothetical protein
MGHGDLLVTQLYLSRQATTAPYVPREASAAGRLRSNAVTVQVPVAEILGLQSLRGPPHRRGR